jgi:hypothetical protein
LSTDKPYPPTWSTKSGLYTPFVARFPFFFEDAEDRLNIATELLYALRKRELVKGESAFFPN